MNYELIQHSSLRSDKKDWLIARIALAFCAIFILVIIILACTRTTYIKKNECAAEQTNIESTTDNIILSTSSCSCNECPQSTTITENVETTQPTCIPPGVTNTSSNNKNVCVSERCIRSAADILLSMDKSVDPCEDFYRFSCGRWSSQHPNHAWFSENSDFAIMEAKVTSKTIKVLKEKKSNSEPVPVQQSKDFFQSCVDQDTRDKYAYKPIFKYLPKLGLPAVPRYFNMTGDSKNIHLYKFDWIKTDVAMNKLLNVQLLVDCNVRPNMFDTSKNNIVFGVPSTKLLGYESLALSTLQHDKFMAIDTAATRRNLTANEEKLVKAHLRFMQFTITTLLSEKLDLPEDFDDRILNAVIAISDIQSFLEQIKEKMQYVGQDYYDVTSVDQIQQFSDKMVLSLTKKVPSKKLWEPYLNQLFHDTKISLNHKNKNEIHILPTHLKYYGDIASLLSTELEAKIELWAWWQAVKNLIIHTTSDVKIVIDKLLSTADDDKPSKDISCATLTKNYMDYAVTYALADESFFKTVKPNVEAMLDKIKGAFESGVNSLTWMDSATKQLTIEKSSAMKHLIGLPEWVLNKKLLEKYYSSLTINAGTYLDNLIEITAFKRRLTLERLNSVNNNDWRDSPLKVNAYNNILLNTIIIPMAIIDFPFYNRGLDVLNFGTLGTLLGHELTHGFDNTGRKFNKHGNYEQWWSVHTIMEFYYRAICFVDQYNDFYIPDVDAYINGTISLGENIADNGGLHHAFTAYQNHKKIIGEEPKLPGLEKYTNEQLFFMSYASMWCDDENERSLKLHLEDAHCPNKYRVLGSMINSKAFATAFNCPVGSKMNPRKQKCNLW